MELNQPDFLLGLKSPAWMWSTEVKIQYVHDAIPYNLFLRERGDGTQTFTPTRGFYLSLAVCGYRNKPPEFVELTTRYIDFNGKSIS